MDVLENPDCGHVGLLKEDVRPRTLGCEECLRSGDQWVHLRICLECGHVGCCDASKGKHATKHFHSTGHPVIASFEPGERWGWCFLDEATLEFRKPFRTDDDEVPRKVH